MPVSSYAGIIYDFSWTKQGAKNGCSWTMPQSKWVTKKVSKNNSGYKGYKLVISMSGIVISKDRTGDVFYTGILKGQSALQIGLCWINFG